MGSSAVVSVLVCSVAMVTGGYWVGGSSERAGSEESTGVSEESGLDLEGLEGEGGRSIGTCTNDHLIDYKM